MTTTKNKSVSKLFALVLTLMVIVSSAVCFTASAEETTAQPETALSIPVTTEATEKEIKSYGYFNYRVDTDSRGDYIYIVEYTGKGGDVSIPATIDNLPVYDIGADAFWYRDDVTAVNLPAGLERIEARAFQNCKNLSVLYIPDSVIEIGDAAFENCEKLTSINIPASLLYVGGSAFDGTQWFNANYSGYEVVVFDNKHLYKYNGDDAMVNIPEGIISISSNAFNGKQNLTYVNIPDSVEYFGAYCFYNCTNLKSLCISDTTKYIGDGAFGVDYYKEGNEPAYVEGFVLYSNNGTRGAEYAAQVGIKRKDTKENVVPEDLPDPLVTDITIQGETSELKNIIVFVSIVGGCAVIVTGLYIYFTVAEKKKNPNKKDKKEKKDKKNKKS